MQVKKKRKPIKSISRDGVGYEKMVLGYNREDKKGPKLDYSYRPFLNGTEYEIRPGTRKMGGK